ncbi:MAG: YjbF family lipoprotein [Pseudomonadota bacterium]|nr:YjbF family lipoprotein [Pseudomonadota bacterium]
MKWFTLVFLTLAMLTSCSNSSEFETSEIKAIKMLRETINARKTPTMILDVKKIVTRKKIDEAKIPVLFIELENKQNGTLTLYPGQGVGETWLGADGAIITFNNGILKATRGMRNDLMGATSSIPHWSQIEKSATYSRKFTYLDANNQTYSKKFACYIETDGSNSSVTIFDVDFSVQRYDEICAGNSSKINNVYFVDRNGLVRRSIQYHGEALGSIIIERLER